MRGPYIVACTGIAVSAQQDIIELTTPATCCIVIHEFSVSQSSDVGDAAEEILTVLAKRGTSATTPGTGGTIAIAFPVSGTTNDAGTVAKINNTTKMTGGTIRNVEACNWNIRQELNKVYTPETRPEVGPSSKFTIELASTPADAITLSASIKFFETT